MRIASSQRSSEQGLLMSWEMGLAEQFGVLPQADQRAAFFSIYFNGGLLDPQKLGGLHQVCRGSAPRILALLAIPASFTAAHVEWLKRHRHLPAAKVFAVPRKPS